MPFRPLVPLMLLIAILLQSGCASLLPSARKTSESPWQSYAEVKAAFDQVVVGQTTEEDLKTLGFDVKQARNVKILNYLDIAATVQAIPSATLDPGLRACLEARADCRAYVFQPERTNSQRIGNFWLDILSFRRKTHDTGWRFKGLIVFVNSHVAYKLSSGEPQIDQMQDQHNPLGPFQDPAGLAYKVIP